MPNSWSRQAYVQGFDCKSITFKKTVYMFERMEIFEPIYKGVVEPSYFKNILWQTPTMLVTSGKREENMLRNKLAPRRVRELASAEKGM